MEAHLASEKLYLYISLAFLKFAILIIQIKDGEIMQFRSKILRVRLDPLFGDTGWASTDVSNYP